MNTNEEDHILIKNQLDRIEGCVGQISTTIHGNGQPGLKTEVAQHSQTLAVLKRIVWGLGAALGTVATAYAMSLM